MPDLDDLALWNHQRAAVDECERYFAQAPQGRSALVHYPTGAGKTGIMAALARRRATTAPVLVVCPSAALVAQLEGQFRAGFWEKIGAAEEWHFRHTGLLVISKVDKVVELIGDAQGEEVAIFATIQALQQIHADELAYAKLAGLFGTVFFDEGHREPAPQWARAARGLGAPTILFSATPYRNDLKVFGVDQDFTSFLSFEAAAGQGLIRPVVTEEMALPQDATGFAAAVIARRDELLAAGRILPNHKMIIRADQESEVSALFFAFSQLLAGRGDGVLAIHDTFDTEGPPGAQKLGKVPANLSERAERFLIHQHMLTEGIDDPACTMLALYAPFRNERQLVQQVGRLTRHPGPLGQAAPPALVITRPSDGVVSMWNRFLAYDQACVANGGRPPLRDQAFVDRVLEALPDLDYVDGQFRRRADLANDGIQAEIRVPLSAVIFETTPAFDLDAFEAAISAQLSEEDRIEQASGPIKQDPTCRFHLSISLTQSPLLAESLFQTASLEITAYAHRNGRLFFYDSGGLWADELAEIRGRLGPRRLGALLPASSKALTAVTLRNTDLGPLALRGRSFQAPSVTRAGVFVGEHTNVVTRATGRPTDTVRRTLGFTSARVRQGEGPQATLPEFSAWCTDVSAELDANPAPSQLFERFANSVDPPADTTPHNILVDLDAYKNVFRTEDNRIVSFDLDSACADIALVAGGPAGFLHRFELIVDGNPVHVWIRWDSKKQKYWLSSRELTQFHDRSNPKVTLLHRLNRQQPFRIILEGATVFAYGRFYSIDLQLGQANGAGALVLGLLHAIPGLQAITSEKGNLSAAAATWPPLSLFGKIDEELRAPGPGAFGRVFEALVCDDLGTEVADFIGVDEAGGSRVVFIAAKWKAGVPGGGATGIYDVSAQALKDLAYLKADAQPLPGAARKWDGDWMHTGGRVPRRRVGPNSAAFRKLFQKVRGNPAAGREVWIVLGGGILSRAAVVAGVNAPNPRAHTLQLFHLLLSLYAGCQSIGVDLKVFCAP
ncbi:MULTISPECIES: DEAD/DEAH box helicase [unclassified Caulobacter]|uniref:DEAD/DEAH box helicase n=1 Tax=unclassified Caulobacter TaxID=2648921 RepID=UPI000AB6E108|nr:MULTISPECIES: DEAD/DEAH box helicase family protein [unclassified Caulobacter]